jgi:hypothetical protein
MSDPRNVAHDKKVKQEKAHQHASGVEAKSKRRHGKKTAETVASGEPKEPAVTVAPVEQRPGEYEKSQAVLSKLKEMEFHSRANIEALAQLTLTIEEELKQKEFSAPIGEVYSAQDAFHTRITKLIQNYETKVGTMQPSG